MTEQIDAIQALELNRKLLARNIAGDCARKLAAARQITLPLPTDYSPDYNEPTTATYLIWMCQRIEDNFDKWSSTRMHRWLGYVQGVMLAYGWSSLNDARSMVSAWKKTYPENEVNE